MVRHYIRKTDRGLTYTKAQLLEAVEKIKSGECSGYSASTRYNIPRTTLSDHVSGKHGKRSLTMGKPRAVADSDERTIAENLSALQANGFNLGRKELLEIVGFYFKSNKIKTAFKFGVPKEFWLTSFARRHGIPTKPLFAEFGKQEKEVIAVKEFYSIVEARINELDLADKPGQIWFMAEHNFRDGKRVFNYVNNKDITVVTAFNAEGKKAPLLTVFKGEESQNWMLGQQINVSHSLGMCRDVFKNYFTTIFLNYIDDSRPNLVIYDGQRTHVDINLIKDARKAKVTLINSPYLDDLDLSITRTLKEKWSKVIAKTDSVTELASVIANVFDGLEASEIEEGFRNAGVYPFEAACDSKFDSDQLKAYEKYVQYKMSHSLVCDEPEQVMITEDVQLQMTFKTEPEEPSSDIEIEVEPMNEPNQTEANTYSCQQLKTALIAVKKGLTVMDSTDPNTIQIREVYSGPRTLTNGEENQLVEWVLSVTDAGFTVTKENLADAVENLIADFETVPFKTKSNMYEGFLDRHPKVAVILEGKPAEAMAESPEVWLDRVQTYLKKRNVEDILLEPRRVFNCGETAFYLTANENKAIPGRRRNTNEDMTILMTASADGTVQAPAVIFHLKQPSVSSASSWTKAEYLSDQITDVFYPWLVDHSIPLPVIMFMNHTTHINLTLSEFCKENQIIPIAIPDQIEPLESMFHSLKQYCKEKHTKIEKTKKEELAKDLEGRIITDFSDEIISGFKSCGLYPFDMNSKINNNGTKEITIQINAGCWQRCAE